jgi:hypothetical protein
LRRTTNSSSFKEPNFDSHHYTVYLQYQQYIKGKGKAIPLQAWTGPEGSRRLRLSDFKTVGT